MSESVPPQDCEYCGDSYTPLPQNEDESRFCSRSCSARWHSENNPNSAQNIDPTKAKADAKQAALDRDEHTCQRCGSPVGEQRDESTKDFEVHHLIPKSAGGTDHLDNLVTLCSHCHTNAHWDMKKIPRTHPELLDELREVVCKEESE